MAVLELGVELQNIKLANDEANKLQQTLKSIASVKVDFKGTVNESYNSAIKQARLETELARKESINLGSANKKAFEDSRVSVNKAREAVILYNLEQKKLRDEAKKNASGGAYSQLSRELTEMRNEAKNLGAQLIKLEKAGLSTGVMANTIRNRFDEAQKEVIDLDNSLKKLDGSLGQNQRNVGHYEQAMRGANGVSMEFARIIQDAPFGMMGIGNNIQQLTANWQSYTQQAKAAAQANGTTITTGTLLRGVLQNMITPAGLLTLGVSAITSAWTAYTMWSQKAKKSTAETKSEIEKFKETLDSFQQAQLQGVNNYAQEITKLSSLFKITQDVNSSVAQRKIALSKLQDLYPQVFKNLDIESIKTSNAQQSYNELRDSIISAARAQAAFAKIGELAGDDFVNTERQNQISKEHLEIYKTISALKKRAKLLENEANSGVTIGVIYQQIEVLQEKALELEKNALSIQGERRKISEEQNRLSDYAVQNEKDNIEIQKTSGDEAKKKTKSLKEQYDYLTKIREILEKGKDKLELFNVSGLQKDLTELRHEFRDINQELDTLQDKLKNDNNVSNRSEVQSGLNEARLMTAELEGKREYDIRKKWHEEYLRLLEEFNVKYGVENESSREKDFKNLLLSLKKDADKLRETGADWRDILYQGTMMAHSKSTEITQRWDNKDLVEWGKMNDQLIELMDKPFKSTNNNSLKKELEKRIFDMKNVYTLLQNTMGVPFDNAEWESKVAKVMVDFDNAFRENALKEYNDILKSNFANLLDGFKSISWSFSSALNLFRNTTDGIISGVNDQNMKGALDNLSDVLSKRKDELGEPIKIDTTKLGLAIGSAVGNIIQGATKGSVVGQAVGGGLSGAMAGVSLAKSLSIAGPWGAIAGAGIGILGGIIGGSAQKKAEEQRRKQIEEQRKTNILLERMNALSYASQIIGSRTQYGVISGVNRNEFGQIVFRINGTDILASAERTMLGYGR